MKNYLDSVLVHLKATNVRDMLEMFVKNGVALKSVHDTAKNLTATLKSGQAQLAARLKIERTTMMSKLLDARNYNNTTRKNMEKCKEKMSEYVREGTFVRKLFMNLVKSESEENWKVEKKKAKVKFERNKEKQNRKKIENFGTICGVKVGDEELEDLKDLKISIRMTQMQ